MYLGSRTFHYITKQDVCYLAFYEAAFPKKLAFAYLDLHSEFDEQPEKKAPTLSRPYSCIGFDTYIQKTKKLCVGTHALRNLGSINTELHHMQRIIVANIEEVLQSALDSKANNLSNRAKKYLHDAKYLNMHSTYVKLASC
ncbi:PREDICTED: vesicle-trafficking protein SEC22b-like [Chrysochloris asiatica]|uniref:Vesicle-trafficking protein SEC22b-like n=1 Tax=Chrysochloris asiatica TaxID=185453 RepID=A0A9B0U555_CHRAS|nr:PREDICTED: vesicle-trafficking protein SEC22b-like [Chrysochloris asiatica]